MANLPVVARRPFIHPVTFGWLYAAGAYASILFWIPEDMVYYYGEDRMSLGTCIITSPLWPIAMPFRMIGFYQRVREGWDLKNK